MARDANRLPFEVGQQAESKCFIVGFRSAWFRCKIRQKGNIGCSLEFYDFPDEKVTWTKLYQKPPKSHGQPQNKPELMMRPSFPPFFRESARPNLYPSSDVVVIVEDDWQVGDLVDWWSDGCFWSGRVIQLLENDRVQIELPDPPVGEGKSYEALCKDLRPSLQWSPEHGWTVPISREYGSSQYCARLVQPLKQERSNIPIQLNLDGIAAENYSCEASVPCDDTRDSSVEPKRSNIPTQLNLDGIAAENYSFEASVPRDDTRDSSVEPERSNIPIQLNLDGIAAENYSCEASVPCDGTRDSSAEPKRRNIPIQLNLDGIAAENYSCEASVPCDDTRDSSVEPSKGSSSAWRYGSSSSPDKVWSRKSKYTASIRHVDTVESAIMELEELANKIRWLKGLLQFGFRWSNAMKPSWKILEN